MLQLLWLTLASSLLKLFYFIFYYLCPGYYIGILATNKNTDFADSSIIYFSPLSHMHIGNWDLC